MLAGMIADAVEQRLREQHRGQRTLYRRELGVCAGGGRIDVASVNGSITGCEIKSSRDGLARLDRQVETYSRVVDQAILVVERANPQRVADLVPGWWGVWRAIDGAGGVRLEVLRPPGSNPAVDPFAVAQLLWRAEAFDALRQRGLHRGRSSWTRWRLWRALADEVPCGELSAEARRRLRARPGW